MRGVHIIHSHDIPGAGLRVTGSVGHHVLLVHLLLLREMLHLLLLQEVLHLLQVDRSPAPTARPQSQRPGKRSPHTTATLI
jgi:hypothetical protein